MSVNKLKFACPLPANSTRSSFKSNVLLESISPTPSNLLFPDVDDREITRGSVLVLLVQVVALSGKAAYLHQISQTRSSDGKLSIKQGSVPSLDMGVKVGFISSAP